MLSELLSILRYEKLVNNPKVEIEKILERLGVPFHEDMLDFYSNSRMVHTNSMTRKCIDRRTHPLLIGLTSLLLEVRKKLYFDSIGSWRRYYNQIVDVNGRNAGLVYELEQFLPKMLENGMLPFPYEINWKLDLEFAY